MTTRSRAEVGQYTRGAEFIEGIVDIDVHANPDLIERRGDDLALACELRDAGFAAGIHRNHFAPTAERARLASDATGFPLLGAIVLNASAGGVNPSVTELALRMGAVWVGLPDIGAAHSRSLIARMPEPMRSTMSFGVAVPVVDAENRVLPEVLEVMALARDHGAALALGYIHERELDAVARAAMDVEVPQIVLAKPFSSTMQLSFEAALACLELTGAWLEINALNSFHPHGGQSDHDRAQSIELMRKVGPERVILSSDAGRAPLAGPAESMAAGCEALLDAGFTATDVRRMVRDNPAELIGV